VLSFVGLATSSSKRGNSCHQRVPWQEEEEEEEVREITMSQHPTR
jgi:hypothetical protein